MPLRPASQVRPHLGHLRRQPGARSSTVCDLDSYPHNGPEEFLLFFPFRLLRIALGFRFRWIRNNFKQIAEAHIESEADLLKCADGRVVVCTASDALQGALCNASAFGQAFICHPLAGVALVRLHRLSKFDRNHRLVPLNRKLCPTDQDLLDFMPRLHDTILVEHSLENVLAGV